MNSEPLSASSPRRGKGRSSAISSTAARTPICPRPSTARVSTQMHWMLVRLREWMNSPSAAFPEVRDQVRLEAGRGAAIEAAADPDLPFGPVEPQGSIALSRTDHGKPAASQRAARTLMAWAPYVGGRRRRGGDEGAGGRFRAQVAVWPVTLYMAQR